MTRSLTLLSLAMLITLIALVPSAAALVFTSPSNGANFTANATVTFTWDTEPVTFTLTGTAPQDINSTGTSATLDVGSYTATIINATNDTASVSFTVIAPVVNQTQNTTQNQTNQTQNTTQPFTNQIGVSSDLALYEAGMSARIRVTVNHPESLTLTIIRPNGGQDTYTIAVTQQTDFLYVTTASGSYSISIVGQQSGATAATSFVAQNSTITAQITGADTGTSSRVISFGSAIQGGLAPFSYAWRFSDNTTSTGATADHVFALPGNYTVTLSVSDSVGHVKNVTKSVIINELTFQLSVTALGQNGRLLDNATVVVTGPSGGSRTDVTNDLGRIRFLNLTAGLYRINTTYRATEFSPVIVYTDNRSINLTDDWSVQVSFPVPDPLVVGYNGTNTTNTTTTNTTNTTNAPLADLTPVTDAAVTPDAAPADPTQSAEEIAAAALTTARTAASADLSDREASLARSETRAALAKLLDFDQQFADANAAIAAASTPDEITAALAKAPKDLSILSRDTVVTRRSAEDAKADIDAYILASAADDATAGRIRYTVEQAILNSSITTRRSVVRVTAGSGDATTYTVIEREAPVDPSMSYIEIIPKTFASDVTALKLHGSNVVVQADPIIKFLTNSYSYVREGDVEGDPSVIPVPNTLLDEPGILGYVAIKLNLASTDRGGLYLALIALAVSIIIAGNIFARSRSGSNGDAFSELASMTIDAAEKGNTASLVSSLKELEAIYASLPQKDRDAVADTMTVLRASAAMGEFRAALAACRAAFTLSDPIAMGSAYERVLAAHGALPQDARVRAQSAVDAIHTELESHLARHEERLEKASA